jgi:hypothetical protein
MFGHLHLSMKQEIKNIHGFVIIKVKHIGPSCPQLSVVFHPSTMRA